MNISTQTKMNIQKVLVITAAYILFNWVMAFYNEAMLNSPFSLGTASFYSFKTHFLTNTLIGVLAGIFGGTMLVTINSRLFRKKSFRFALSTTVISYTLIFCIVTFIISVFTARIELGSAIPFSEMMNQAYDRIMNLSIIAHFLVWGGITLLTLFLLQVNDKFGPGILLKFLMGKYYHPKEEERIFMFLDMRSSTTIAEKIGNEKYFNLLSDLFSDITNTILNHAGEIYQYVGDEVVISWPLKKGVNKANCIHCFLQIRKRLLKLAPFYQKKYNMIPEFKAGLHYGMVTAGEIGSIKKDIIYSGDVLNTTARIQEQCNHYKVDFLISSETFNLIEDQKPYELIPLGSIELRGKERKVELNTIKLN